MYRSPRFDDPASPMNPGPKSTASRAAKLSRPVAKRAALVRAVGEFARSFTKSAAFLAWYDTYREEKKPSTGLLAKIRGNTWQGVFPISDTGEDGYTDTSPVGAFGQAPSGLTDMAGNVWEWTSSSYIPYPAVLNDPRTAPERVQRGGSFLCSTGGCEGFRATARSHSTPETALMHVGFRCAGQG